MQDRFSIALKMVDKDCISSGVDIQLQELYCIMHKSGCKLPSSDELIKIGREIFTESKEDHSMTIVMMQSYAMMLQGFLMLIQLAYAKERM